jgi:hypothetical protein
MLLLIYIITVITIASIAIYLVSQAETPEKEIIPNQSIVSFEYNNQLFLGTILSYKHPYYEINAHTGFYEKTYTKIELHHNRIRKVIAKA